MSKYSLKYPQKIKVDSSEVLAEIERFMGEPCKVYVSWTEAMTILEKVCRFLIEHHLEEEYMTLSTRIYPSEDKEVPFIIDGVSYKVTGTGLSPLEALWDWLVKTIIQLNKNIDENS